jgi:hypothetical protein
VSGFEPERHSRRSGFGGDVMGPLERERGENAAFREAYWRSIREQEERDKAAREENVRNASRERDRSACRVAAELGGDGWQRRLLEERHAGGDQVSRPPLALAFVHSAVAVLRDSAADATAKAGAGVIARAILDDLALLADAAGTDAKGKSTTLARLFGGR